ncbi:alpha-hydroxy-acid oxidizing protein [Thermoleophilia bacterium SCSIO 60948]|nr:alpha-hydroxy-acid oxidizing protein [Thermoleophilia bacterium SCSIO 60948]
MTARGAGQESNPPFTTNLTDLEKVASEELSAEARRYFLAEAGGAAAARANARALRAWRIVPRMFIGREERTLDTTILGVDMPAPVILGPVGRQDLADPQAESATARAAAGLDLTYVHSQRASQPPAAVAAAAPQGSRWYGFDWPDGGEPDLAALAGAQAAGCTHLVLSPPQPGQRWAPLAAIREAWTAGPILLSGIQNVQAARMAVRRGFEGIVVSNERGRRGAKPNGTIDRLPKIVDAVAGRAAVLFGSGVRTGPDVYRAMALGADAVMIGRPYVYGLALDGEAGVTHMLRTLLAELEIDLAIAGIEDHLELRRNALVRD